MSLHTIKLSTLSVAAAFLFSAPAFANLSSFTEMDRNQDGRITSEEHSTAATAKFTKADANHDGLLTAGELTGFMMDAKGKSATNAQSKSNKKVTMYDTNSDGQLSQQEFMDGNQARFTKVDVNSDGSISMQEMESAKDMQ